LLWADAKARLLSQGLRIVQGQRDPVDRQGVARSGGESCDQVRDPVDVVAGHVQLVVGLVADDRHTVAAVARVEAHGERLDVRLPDAVVTRSRTDRLQSLPHFS